MTGTEIREALTEVRDAVEVPVVDRVAFQARVRSERRRRTAGRALAATAAAAVVGVAVWAVQPGDTPRTDDAPPVAVDSNPSAPAPAPVSLEGRLTVLMADGNGSYGSAIRVEEVLGRAADGVVVILTDSRVVLVPMHRDGQLVRDQSRWTDLGAGAVQRAWVAEDGTTLAFQDLDGTVHVRRIGSGRDLLTAKLDQESMLAAATPDGFVEVTGDQRVLLHRPGATTELSLGSDRSLTSAFGVEAGGDTVAVPTDRGVTLLDARDGSSLPGDLGGTVGGLSPDGRHYAGGADEEALDTGKARAPFVLDTATGQPVELHGLAARGILDVAWQDDDRFLVLGGDAARPGDRILWDCSVALRGCEERYDDPTGSLEIPSS